VRLRKPISIRRCVIASLLAAVALWTASTGWPPVAAGYAYDSISTSTTAPTSLDVWADAASWRVRAAAGRSSYVSRIRVAADGGGSALADASSAAFKAADSAGDWTVSAKHLFGAGGRWAKFAEGADPNALAQEALRSPDAQFLPNPNGAPGSFLVRTDLGRVIGSAGQTAVRVVVSNDGRVITAFPVR
jgi:hypothetical protein